MPPESKLKRTDPEDFQFELRLDQESKVGRLLAAGVGAAQDRALQGGRGGEGGGAVASRTWTRPEGGEPLALAVGEGAAVGGCASHAKESSIPGATAREAVGVLAGGAESDATEADGSPEISPEMVPRSVACVQEIEYCSLRGEVR